MDQIPVEEFRTFDEWSQDGYQIIKGSKATWFDGKPMFARRQVQKSIPRSHGGHAIDGWGDFYDGAQDMHDIGDYH